MSAPFTLATIPFDAREPLALLGFRPGREAPDLDYDGFGHARVGHVELVELIEHVAHVAGARRVVRDARVLALHSPDDAEALVGDIELEFWVDDETAIVALLSRFLAARGPGLVAGESAWILALCNPHHARLQRPPGVDLPIYYALGDVHARLEADHAGPWSIDQVTLSLHADRWLTV